MAAPIVAKAAAKVGRKAASDPGAAVLIGVIGVVVLSTMVKRAAGLPGQALGEVWSGVKGFTRTTTAATVDILGKPSEYTTTGLEVAWSQSRSVVEGIVQGEDMDDPGPEYYAKVHYDASGVPIAVPTEINRTAKRIGRAIRRGIGDWSLPGL